MILEQLAYMMDITVWQTSFALKIHLICNGSATGLSFTETIGKQGYPVICLEKIFNMDPVHQFKLQHIEIILLPNSEKATIGNVFVKRQRLNMLFNPLAAKELGTTTIPW